MYLVDSPDPVLFLLIQPFHFILYMHCTVTSLNPVLVPSDLVFFFPPILYLASLNPVQFLLVQIRLFPMQYFTVYCTLPLILSVFILIQILSFSYMQYCTNLASSADPCFSCLLLIQVFLLFFVLM